jgi:acetyl esterase/lipase
VAVWLNGLGLSATVLEYRVSPYRYPWPLADARRAIRVVRSRAAAWSVDPCRIGILGFSAGGHVAAATAILADDPPDVKDDLAPQFSARPDLMVLCYPVISSGEFGHRGSMNNLLGPDPDPALLCRVSLERQVNAATPPAFVWHSTDDPAVPAENAIDLVAALRRHRVDVEFHLFARAGRHGIGLGEPGNAASAWTDLCAEWFRTRGWR